MKINMKITKIESIFVNEEEEKIRKRRRWKHIGNNDIIFIDFTKKQKKK